ncbi:hypothetical protein J4463_00850 [Candidatus Pacearchaeota archaeon]|nr:hypothetical protein [Candidatus Pacearchaeota archaeon]
MIKRLTEIDHLEAALPLLVSAGEYFKQNTSGYVICASSSTTPQGLPSVQYIFDLFEKLPEGHPLKNRFNSEKIRGGYNTLKRLKFDPTRNYEELRAHLTPCPFA